MTWNFPINARWRNLAHVTSRNCMNIAKSAISSAVGKHAVELLGRVTIQYNVHVFSTEDVIFCTRLLVGGVGALN